LYNPVTDKNDSLASANQVIHEQRERIHSLESQVDLLKRTVAEETAMRYKAWTMLADAKKLK